MLYLIHLYIFHNILNISCKFIFLKEIYSKKIINLFIKNKLLLKFTQL